MKGIVEQMREKEVVKWSKFTKEHLDNLASLLKNGAEKDAKRIKSWLKERENNRKELVKKAKELNKEIPFELLWHTYLAPHQTYVGSEFLETYKEWL